MKPAAPILSPPPSTASRPSAPPGPFTLPRRAPLTLADRLGHAFPAQALARGFAVWKRARVVIEEEAPGRVTAKVRGTRTRDVVLEVQGPALFVRCTCPARALEQPGCKHVWATLLEVDRRAGLASLRALASPARLRVAFLEDAQTARDDAQEKAPGERGKKRRAATTKASSPRSAAQNGRAAPVSAGDRA